MAFNINSMPTNNIPTNSSFDRFIFALLFFLLVLLPFSAIDFSFYILLFHRMLWFATGFLAWVIFLGRRGRIEINPVWLVIILWIIWRAGFAAIKHSDYLIVLEVINLATLAGLIAWSLTVIDGQKFANIVLGVVVFFCIDAFVQFITGTDLFGLPPHLTRSWGAFFHGAPAFGVFIMALYFTPLFFIKSNRILFTLIFIFTVGILIANDRAPYLQIPLAALLFLRCEWKYKIIALLTALLVIVMLYRIGNILPFRFVDLIRMIEYFYTNPVEVWHQQSPSSEIYIDIWSNFISGWFRWENLTNVIFGAGWGATPFELLEITESDRGHSVYIDVLIGLGLVGFGFIAYLLVKLARYAQGGILIAAPVFLPFSFFSLFSTPWLFLTSLSIMLTIWAGKARRDS